MASKKNVRKTASSSSTSNGSGATNNNNGQRTPQQHQSYASSQYDRPLGAPPMFSPLGPPPPKKAKTGLFTSAVAAAGPPQQPFLFQGGPPPSSSAYPYPPQPQQIVRPQIVAAGTPPKKSQAQSSKSSKTGPAMQNPYSTSRGLRHFSMKVCEKVEEKGTTTYNEVADELVRELKQAEEAITKAAIARGETPPSKKGKKSKDGKEKKKNHDDKNIRRRVYDALNVLMAMDIITKEKKEITWRGLPGSRVQDHFGDGPSNIDGKPNSRGSGLSRRQRVQQLQDETDKRRNGIKRKRECLQELMTQNVCFQNLLQRNHARETEEQVKRSSGQPSTADAAAPQVEVKLEDGIDAAAQEDVVADDKQQSEESTKEYDKNEKIPLPFIIVSTDSKAVVQCEMCPNRTNVSFDFSLPFEINDDNGILKKLGLNHTSKEALQRVLPPDIYHYCNANGLLQNIVR